MTKTSKQLRAEAALASPPALDPASCANLRTKLTKALGEDTVRMALHRGRPLKDEDLTTARLSVLEVKFIMIAMARLAHLETEEAAKARHPLVMMGNDGSVEPAHA